MFCIGGVIHTTCLCHDCTNIIEKKDIPYCKNHTPTCSICFENVVNGVDVCGFNHWFHYECIMNVDKLSCPCCRRDTHLTSLQKIINYRMKYISKQINNTNIYIQNAASYRFMNFINKLHKQLQ